MTTVFADGRTQATTGTSAPIWLPVLVSKYPSSWVRVGFDYAAAGATASMELTYTQIRDAIKGSERSSDGSATLGGAWFPDENATDITANTTYRLTNDVTGLRLRVSALSSGSVSFGIQIASDGVLG